MPRPLRVFLRFVAPGLFPWIACSAFLLVLERIVVVAGAFALVTESRGNALKMALLLAMLFGIRSALRGMLRARAQVRTHQAAIDALLEGDVVSRSPLATQDAQTAILDGTVSGGRVVSDLLPDLAGDAMSSALFLLYIVATQSHRIVVVGGLGLLCAAAGAHVARTLTMRVTDRANAAYIPVIEDLLTALGGRLEIVANGRTKGFRAEVSEFEDMEPRVGAN